MKKMLMIIAAPGLFLLTFVGQAGAAESVRRVSSVENITAGFNVNQRGGSGVGLSLEIPAVAINPVTVNSTTYQKIDLPAADRLIVADGADDGEPDVPSLTTLIAIPDQAGIQVDVTYSGYDTFEDIDLAPVQPSPAENDPEAPVPFTLDNATYSSDAFYPGELASSSEPVIMRDVRGVQIQLNPVQYNPVRRELRVYRDLAVNISYGGEPVNPKVIRRPYLSDGFYPLYKAAFANFEELFGSMEVKRGGYVIICKPTLVDTLKALAMWKHQKGYTTRIVPTTEINSNGSPTYSQIFTYLRTAYQTWDVPPEYVMLVGDMDGTFVVPDYPYQSYASDHHYTCVEGNDFLPDFFIARLSVDNMTEARIAISKIFKYEKTPLMRDPTHWIRGLSVGYTWYESARLTTLWVRTLQLQNGFGRVDTVFGNGPDANVQRFFSIGPGFIQYRGAGSTDGWWGPSMYVQDLLNLPNNQKLGVLSPLTCGTGDFAGECFGETWIRMGMNPDSLKGGPAFYGVSDHGTHTRWNNPIMVGYFFGIFEQNIYHFAPAAVAGKMQDYRTFPRYINSYVQQYFHTYNMLGDPELELRTKIPILIAVTHPETLEFGLNHVEVNVVDTAGNFIPDAFVSLIKMVDSTEEVYSLGKTDAGGNVSLSFDAQTPGSMILTVSGQNLYPYQGNVELVASDIAVGFDSLAIDDDLSGFSHGNGDSLLNPNETLELYVTLENFGDSLTANNIVASLTAIDPGTVEILDGSQNYGTLGPGERRADETPYVIQVNPDLQDGDIVRLKQTVTDENNDSWYSVIEIPVNAPKFVIGGVTVQEDNNNRLDPGDTAIMVITVINRGNSDGQTVNATISSDDDFTYIIDAASSFGDIPVGDTVSSAADSLVFSVDRSAFAGRPIHFLLKTITATGAKSVVPFTVKVDSAMVSSDPTGPDDYGYYMFDKTDTLYAPHPHYNWLEINPSHGGSGTRLSFPGETDDKSVLITLPFNFIYYGESYQKLIVCTNGFISPDTTRYDMAGNFWDNFFNWPIPDPGNARAQISPFWDDLNYSGSTNGVYTWYDSTEHQYVIEWHHMVQMNLPDSTEYFEVIISDPAYHPTLTGDSEILFQYFNVNNLDQESPYTENFSSVGFESWDEMTGLQYSFDNGYGPGAAQLRDSLAILITTNTGRGGIKGRVTLEGVEDFSGVRVSASTGQYRITSADGDYWLRELPTGSANLKAEIDGYFPGIIDSVPVNPDYCIQDIGFTLRQCPIPANLVASDTVRGEVQVHWDTVGAEFRTGYNIYRGRWQSGAYTKLNDTPLQTSQYTDNTVQDSVVYWYYVTATYSISGMPSESFASNKDSGGTRNIVGISENSPLPKEFFLSQNYPNPFNPTTIISYGLPKDADVRIDIFNLLGQRVLTLMDGYQQAGYKSVIWDGKDGSGKTVTSGVYFYKIEAGSFRDSKKMIMLK